MNTDQEEKILRAIQDNALTNFKNYITGMQVTCTPDIMNHICTNGSTFLSYAVKKSNFTTIEDIVASGVDVNKRETGGSTPLLLAIHLNRLDVVKFLITRGANVNLGDSYETPLMIAVRKNYLDIIEFLLSQSADASTVNFENLSPFFWAIKENRQDILELILKKGVPKDIVDASGNSPLVAAIENNSPQDIIQTLLKYGVDGGTSSLAWAAAKGHLEIIKIVTANAANINEMVDGNTPLAIAVRFKQPEIAKYLIELGANVCKAGDTGKTPLLWAVENEDFEMVKWLLERGAEYIVDSVLLDAIGLKNLKIVELLVEKGALVSGDNSEGDQAEKNSLKRAFEANSVEIARCLIKNGAKVVDALDQNEISFIIELLEKRNIEMVKLLTENGARLNEFGACGHTLLTKSVKMECFEMVQYFVGQGADVNQADKNLLTPLDLAVAANDFRTFEFLVDSGASIDKVSEEGDQTNNRKLTKYYQVAKQNSLKKQKQGLVFGSDQEEAGKSDAVPVKNKSNETETNETEVLVLFK